MTGLRYHASLLLLVGLASAQPVDIATEAPPSHSREMLFKELSSGLANFTVVDIRQRDEVIEIGQIPGSHIFPLNEIEQALTLDDEKFLAKYGFPKLIPDDSNLVVTCRTADKVLEANAILEAHKFTKQRLYLGSFGDWVKNGGDIIKPGKPFSHASPTTESSPTRPVSDSTEPDSAPATTSNPESHESN